MTWHLSGKLKQPWAVQQEALRRSAGCDRYGWFLEQGLGKTAVALNEYVERDDVDLCVVISPQSFKLDWPIAVDDYGLDFLRTGYWPKEDPPLDWDQGLYAINYEGVSRSRATSLLVKLMEERRVMLVIDESKSLGSPRSGWTKSTIELAKRATVVRLLNGTPITQSPLDLYGQLRALGQLNGWTSVEFRNRFCVLGGFMGKQIMTETRNGEELARILDSCSFRALKKDWRADLPNKLYATVHLEMTDRQRRYYDQMLDDFYVMIEETGEDVTAEMVISQMIKLQQIASGFILHEGRAVELEEPSKNPKLRAALDLCDGPGKTIVVHYYKESGQLLINALTKAGFEPAYIQGGMTPAEMIEQKRRFNTDPACRVIVGQERAVARGHTLLGQPGNDRCTRTAFFENSYSLYFRLHAEDRNHRGDQDEPCTCYDFVASGIDEKAIEILTAKREMATALDDIVAALKLDRRRRPCSNARLT